MTVQTSPAAGVPISATVVVVAVSRSTAKNTGGWIERLTAGERPKRSTTMTPSPSAVATIPASASVLRVAARAVATSASVSASATSWLKLLTVPSRSSSSVQTSSTRGTPPSRRVVVVASAGSTTPVPAGRRTAAIEVSESPSSVLSERSSPARSAITTVPPSVVATRGCAPALLISAAMAAAICSGVSIASGVPSESVSTSTTT